MLKQRVDAVLIRSLVDTSYSAVVGKWGQIRGVRRRDSSLSSTITPG